MPGRESISLSPLKLPLKICLKHIFKWAAYRCFQSCSSPGEGLRANQRRWCLGRRALLSCCTACFSGKMQINSLSLLWTTSDKGVLGQWNPFNMPVFSHCTLLDTTCRVSCRGWGVSCAWDVQAIREPCIAMRKLGVGEEAKGPGRLV